MNRINLLTTAIAVCFLFGSTNNVMAQNEASWTYPISHNSFDYFQDNWGNVIITEQGNVTSLNPLSGESNWSFKSNTKKVTITPVEDTPLALIQTDKIQLIDILTGEVYLEDSGQEISLNNYEVFFEKDKMLLSYDKNETPMVAVVDLNNYSNSIKTEMSTKGGLFSGDLRLPSSNGTVFKNKKILTCLNNDGSMNDYDSGEKSMNIIGGTKSGIVTLLVKWKNFRGVDMSTCEVKWNYEASKTPRYFISEANNVIIVAIKKTIDAIDMETGEVLYSHELDKGFSEDPYFHDGKMYLAVGDYIKKYDARSGDLLADHEYEGSTYGLKEIGNDHYARTTKGVFQVDLETLKPTFDKGLGGSNIVWTSKKGNLNYYLCKFEEEFILYCYENDSQYKWKSKVDGLMLKDAFVTNAGVVIATEKKFKLAKNEDGKDLWNYKSEFNIDIAPNADRSRFYGIVSSYSFHIDNNSGEFTALPKFKLKDFKQSESQSHILVNENSYIMKSGNNFHIRDLDGNEILTKFYKPHSNTSKLLGFAAAAAQVGAVATGNAQEIVQVSDGETGEVLHQGSLFESDKYGREMADARRRIANSSDLKLPFVFTRNDQKQKLFIFLDPNTGEEFKSIEIREEEPAYSMDTYDGILFYVNKKSDRFEAHTL